MTLSTPVKRDTSPGYISRETSTAEVSRAVCRRRRCGAHHHQHRHQPDLSQPVPVPQPAGREILISPPYYCLYKISALLAGAQVAYHDIDFDSRKVDSASFRRAVSSSVSWDCTRSYSSRYEIVQLAVEFIPYLEPDPKTGKLRRIISFVGFPNDLAQGWSGNVTARAAQVLV